jgi:hypothetical protein
MLRWVALPANHALAELVLPGAEGRIEIALADQIIGPIMQAELCAGSERVVHHRRNVLAEQLELVGDCEHRSIPASSDHRRRTATNQKAPHLSPLLLKFSPAFSAGRNY